MRVAYEVATADMSGPVLNRPALKKYGDVLPSAYSQYVAHNNVKKIHRPARL